MSQAPILPFAPDAFIADTTGLNARETGAYFMLLLCQWRNNGLPLEYNPKKLQRMMRLSNAEYRRVWPEIKHFFIIENDTISQKRLQNDFDIVIQKIETNRQNGALGGKAKSLKNKKPPLANGTNSLSVRSSEKLPYHKPDTDTDIIKNIKKDLTNEFEAFWIGYGKIGSKKKAFDKYKIVRRTVEYETLARAHLIYEQNLKKENWKKKRHLETWLNQEGWNDVYPKLVKEKPSWQL